MFVVLKSTRTSVCDDHGGNEDGGAAHEADEKRGEEQPEDGAVEDRAEDVHRFDQVLDQVGEERERDRDRAPARR